MSETLSSRTSQPTPSLICRLYQQRPGDARRCFVGVAEITNATQEEFRIPWDHDPLQHLDLRVFDEGGVELNEYLYGELFNPIGATEVLRLQPGEAYTHTVHLLDVVSKSKWKNGVYTIRASYRVGEHVACAEQIQITVTDETIR